MEHQQAALRKAIAAMSAFTDPEGNMPADTGEFRDLKEALSDCEAALLTMPDEALNKDDHQCCGKCQAAQIGNEPLGSQPTPEQFRAIIQDLSNRLMDANMVVTALVMNAGGSVTISAEDAALVPGHQIVSEVSEDGSTFTFRAVPVPQQVAQ